MSVHNKYKKFKNSEKRSKFKIKDKRVKIKDESQQKVIGEKGRVVTTIGAINQVRLDNGELIECHVAGTLVSKYTESSIVAVGDNVIVDLSDEVSSSGLKKGVILKIETRETVLSRVSPKNKNAAHVIAANADQILIYMAADSPKYNKRLIDRYLVAAKSGGLDAVICINKIDLFDMNDIDEDLYVYWEDLKIPVTYTCATDTTGVPELRKLINGKSTVITGPSGVGKSTLINVLVKEEIQDTSEVSEKTDKGQHTTSFVRSFDLPDGGNIIDSPGIREFALWNIDIEELPTYFEDFNQYHHECKFAPCTHTHEPKCAVKEAVEKAEIDPERYESYLLLRISMEEEGR